jgi:GTPase Era involved in 16S rRNA processing
MRGGLNYEEAMYTSTEERKIINEIIKENLETTKNSKLPFF